MTCRKVSILFGNQDGDQKKGMAYRGFFKGREGPMYGLITTVCPSMEHIAINYD